MEGHARAPAPDPEEGVLEAGPPRGAQHGENVHLAPPRLGHVVVLVMLDDALHQGPQCLLVGRVHLLGGRDELVEMLVLFDEPALEEPFEGVALIDCMCQVCGRRHCI